ETLPKTLKGTPGRRLRIRYVSRVGQAPVDTSITASLDRAAVRLAALGHEVEPGDAPYDLEQVERIWETLASVGAARVVQAHDRGDAEVTAAIAALSKAGA